MSNVLGTAFVNFAAGFGIAAMLAIWGIPTIALLILQIALVAAAGIVAPVIVRRARRTPMR